MIRSLKLIAKLIYFMILAVIIFLLCLSFFDIAIFEKQIITIALLLSSISVILVGKYLENYSKYAFFAIILIMIVFIFGIIDSALCDAILSKDIISLNVCAIFGWIFVFSSVAYIFLFLVFCTDYVFLKYHNMRKR